ncbi:MAG TPA: CDP-diacylglycerol--glycerol-3-phosphate 3-phosphatidyltransferase [Clostridiales bacterium]|jgi:CDP-diacylglycerol--glycerol-3-phosphate 3-phosphatidyltransferase|nr:CDP-diacylglycerol--glycerol-3-phosphate 3-phosphatidyltransferase [Clostridiales bacterium]
MNLPNKLTVARMILTPIFLIIFMNDKIPYNELIGLIVYCIGSFTDFLDGKIARKRNLISVFGKLFDPIADKMLTTAALLALMSYNMCSIYIVFIVLTREFAVTGIRLTASAQGIVIPANIWGKIKTFSQMAFTIFIMIGIVLRDFAILPETFPLALVSNILLWITAIAAVVSGVVYVKDGVKMIDFN